MSIDFDAAGDRLEPRSDAAPIHHAAHALDTLYKAIREDPDHPLAADPMQWFKDHDIRPGCVTEELHFYLDNMMKLLSHGIELEAVLSTMWITGLQVGYKTRELQVNQVVKGTPQI